MDGVKKFLDRFPVAFGRAAATAAGAINCVFGTRGGNGLGREFSSFPTPGTKKITSRNKRVSTRYYKISMIHIIYYTHAEQWRDKEYSHPVFTVILSIL
jgi:hypothetical protein